MRPYARSLLLCAALAGPSAAQAWESIGAPLPGIAAFDPDRDRLVHVGYDRRVHEWQNGAWFLRPTTAPAVGIAREYSVEGLRWVHDPVRHRMLLFVDSGGGRGLFASDGETWTPLPLPTLPLFPTLRALAFDTARSRLVLVVDDATYEFDGQTWITTVAAGTPIFDTMTFDPGQQRLMSYGTDAGGVLGVVSTYDGVHWTSTSAGVPLFRNGTALAFDPLANVMVLHGCTEVFGMAPDADDWEWNGSQWTHLVGTGTFKSFRDSLAATPIGLLRVEQDTFRLVSLRAAQTWIQVGATVPPVSVTHPVADPIRGGVHGLDYSTTGTNLWRLDDRDWVSSSSTTGAITAMAFDPVRQALVGIDLWPNSTSSEWTWNGTAWSSVPFSGAIPPFRYETMTAFDAARGEFLVFGGYDYLTPQWTNDLWSYGNGAWTQHPAATAMSPRAYAGMVYDPVQQRTLLVGGYSSLDDTWSWNGTAWQQLSPAHAPFSGPCALVFDPVSQQPLAISLMTDDTLGVFAHDGTNWNLLSLHPKPVTLPYQVGFAAAIEPGTNRIVVSLYNITIRLTPNPALVEQQGAGCRTPLRISARTFARVGENDAGIDLRGVPGGALLGLSLTSANVALGGGCTLLVGTLDLAQVLGMNTAGFGSVTLPVPPTPALAGLTVFAQAAQLDPASPIGIAVSSRLALTIGE